MKFRFFQILQRFQPVKAFFQAHTLWLIFGSASVLLAFSLTFTIPIVRAAQSEPEETTLQHTARTTAPSQTDKPTDETGLTYRSLSQDTCMLTGIGSCLKEELVIPSKNQDGKRVVAIGERAFADCTFLTSVTIPAEVQNIGTGAFLGCSSLVVIEVARDNEHFSSQNGVLFNKGKSCLLCYPPSKGSKNYLLPNGVTRIAAYAFYGNRNLTHLLYEETVDSFRNIEIDEGNSLLSTVTVTCNYVGAKG